MCMDDLQCYMNCVHLLVCVDNYSHNTLMYNIKFLKLQQFFSASLLYFVLNLM
jgi:hypothetical protein